MNLYLVVPLLTLVATLQSTLAPRLVIAGAKPELVLLFVVAWSVRRGLEEGLAWALCGGIALDLFSGAPLGTSVLALMAAAAVTALVRLRVERSSAALPWVMAALTMPIYYAVDLIVLSMLGWPVDAGDAFLRRALPAAIYNTIGMGLVYSFLTWLDRRTGQPELRW